MYAPPLATAKVVRITDLVARLGQAGSGELDLCLVPGGSQASLAAIHRSDRHMCSRDRRSRREKESSNMSTLAGFVPGLGGASKSCYCAFLRPNLFVGKRRST